MVFDVKSVGMAPEILASNEYQAVPLKLTDSGVVKAGTPIKNDGSKIAAGTDAIGILLYDVDTDRNPNGSVVVKGIINWDKCKDYAGEDANAEIADIAKALPNIVFRDKEGKTYVGGAAASE